MPTGAQPWTLLKRSWPEQAKLRDMFEAMDSVLRTYPEVGEYNQKI
jgi:hypothetical protein